MNRSIAIAEKNISTQPYRDHVSSSSMLQINHTDLRGSINFNGFTIAKMIKFKPRQMLSIIKDDTQ
jgi:hypothetical protein